MFIKWNGFSETRRVKRFLEISRVKGFSQICRVKGFSQICRVKGFSEICRVKGFSEICRVKGFSQICRVKGFSEICRVKGFSEICRVKRFLEICRVKGFSEICRVKERRLSSASANLIFAFFRVVWGKTPVLANWTYSVCGGSKRCRQNICRLFQTPGHCTQLPSVLSGHSLAEVTLARQSQLCPNTVMLSPIIKPLGQSVNKGDYTPKCTGKPEGPAS